MEQLSEDQLLADLERMRVLEVQRSKRRSMFILVPVFLGIAALVVYTKVLSDSLRNERAARIEAVEKAKEANYQREKAEQANVQLNQALAGLKQEQAKVPDKIAATAACVSYAQQGDNFLKDRRLIEAEAAYNQARDCQTKLNDRYRDNELQFQLSITCNSLGNVRLASKNFRGALSAFEEALKIREQLASTPEAEPRWKLGKFYSLLYTSDAAARTGDRSKALVLAKQALSFAKDDPNRRTELSIAEEQLRKLESKAQD